MPRKSNLPLVTPNNAAEAAIMSADVPPVALTVLAIDPLSEFRADQHRRKMDAQGEIDLLTEQERLADAALAAKLKAAEDALDRLRVFETQKRDAEHERVAAEIENYRQIVLGADAALAAIDEPEVVQE